jgi:hypothetical protein
MDASAPRRVAPQPLKVIFVAGWLRSGSTLLTKLLDQVPGFLSLGELYFLWDQGLVQNRLCGCSLAFHDCPFWSRIARPLLDSDRQEIEAIVNARNGLRSRHFWRLMVPGGRHWLRARAERYSHALETFYRTLPERDDARVVVDASKFSSHGFALAQAQGIDLTVVHLVRDPRAVAFSWSRKRSYWKFSYSPFRSALHWIAQNVVTERLWTESREEAKYVRVRYEDFVRDPRHTVQSIAALVGEEADLAFFSSRNTARLQPTHTVAGNPARFSEGEIEIAADEEWRRAISHRDRWLVTAMTLPLLIRYGYPVRAAMPVKGRKPDSETVQLRA